MAVGDHKGDLLVAGANDFPKACAAISDFGEMIFQIGKAAFADYQPVWHSSAAATPSRFT